MSKKPGEWQQCPNCQAEHDVSIFVSGQRVRCSRCGIRFEVRRSPGGESPKHASAPADGNAAVDRATVEAPTSGSAASPIPEALATADTMISKALKLPGFEILRTLGKGGMGEVYLARQVSLGRLVAVKVLAPHLSSDTEFVRRFEKEAAALAALSHPNIVGIIDRGRTDSTLYFAMEYVDGPSLREIIDRGGLPPREAIEVIVQVCRAIDYAHTKGIIHRDLKPENILVDGNGTVKVADFGLAGMVGGDERLHLTRTDVAMGTFHYMAPEQRRSARDVDARADLYSLGVLLYETLTGEVPEGRFRLPSERRAGLDARLDEIVCKALEADPADRFQRASAVGAALEAVLAGSKLPSGLPPAAAPGGETVPERPQAKAASAASMALSAADGLGRVVERARGGLKWVFQVALVVLVTVVAIAYFVPGLLHDDAPAPPSAPAPGTQRVGSGKLLLPIAHHEDIVGGGSIRRFDFESDLAGHVPWYTYRGYWLHRDGALVQDVFGEGHGVVRARRMPRAFLGRERFFAEGYRIEATVVGDRTPPGGAMELADELLAAMGDARPEVKLYLYRNKRHFFALTARYGEDGGYALAWNLGDGQHFGRLQSEGPVEPVEGEPLRLAMWIEDGWIHGAVNGTVIGSAQVGPLTEENWGKAGVGCQYLRCRFDDMEIRGRTRPLPQPVKAGAEPGAEPLEP
ncbi:MAG: serine/threonine protein kinase [Deltaproteobacteria bacterium]|nr:MAG: serine/threonine protein kinase [Deltaproteobacteria bacterium]